MANTTYIYMCAFTECNMTIECVQKSIWIHLFPLHIIASASVCSIRKIIIQKKKKENENTTHTIY